MLFTLRDKKKNLSTSLRQFRAGVVLILFIFNYLGYPFFEAIAYSTWPEQRKY